MNLLNSEMVIFIEVLIVSKFLLTGYKPLLTRKYKFALVVKFLKASIMAE